jgi:signal recognition particle GTPase
LTGNKVLERADIRPLLKSLGDSLIEKNVSSEIAESISSSVETQLLKTKT